MTLGKRQTKILQLLTKNSYTIPELAKEAQLDDHIVKNIITEFYDAELIRKTEQGVITLKDKTISFKSVDEKNEWQKVQWQFKPELKNLGRKV